MRFTLLIITMAGLLLGTVQAQDWKSRLASADSIERIRKFFHKFETFGEIHESKIETKGGDYFVMWVSNPKNPQVFFWAYRRKASMWTLVVDHAGDAEKELVWSFTKQDFVFVDYTPEKPETKNGEQDGADQPATAPESKPEGNDKPEPEAEGRSR